MSERFSGRTILVTGGTSGIGRETVLHLVREGANVAFTGRRAEQGAEVERAARDVGSSSGGTALFIQGDVSKEADAKRAVEQTIAKFGALHGAFNNAGIEGTMGPIVEQTEQNYRHVFDVNVAGVLYALKHEIPAIINSSGGSIVNTSSVAGHIGMPGMGVYIASKHAVEGLTKTAALEVARQGVRVNAVSPAGVKTEMYDRFLGHDPQAEANFAEMHPIGRAGRSEEIASAVLYLLSDESSFITGTSLALDGGWLAR